MANEIRDAKQGLADRLATIPKLRVYTHEPDTLQPANLPVAVIRFTGRSQFVLGGSSFMGFITVTVIMGPRMSEEATLQLDEMMEPLGIQSIEAALDGDNTWGGTVDYGKLVTENMVDDVGYRNFAFYDTGPLYAADFNIEFVKQVTA